MTNPVINLTADVSRPLSFFEAFEDILEISDTGFELLYSFLEVFSFEVDIHPTTTAGNCCVVFDVPDSFGDFISALRAGNV